MSVYGHFNLSVNIIIIIIVTLFLCSPLSVLCIIVLLYSAAIFHPICMEYGYIIVRVHINLSHAGMISKMMILLFHNCIELHLELGSFLITAHKYKHKCK